MPIDHDDIEPELSNAQEAFRRGGQTTEEGLDVSSADLVQPRLGEAERATLLRLLGDQPNTDDESENDEPPVHTHYPSLPSRKRARGRREPVVPAFDERRPVALADDIDRGRALDVRA